MARAEAQAAGARSQPALWPGPWPAEDGGPRRVQAPAAPGLGIAPGERLELAAVRDAVATTMIVLRDPGEVYALRHTVGANPLRDPVTAWVERLDPLTLAALGRSADLPAGPFWPGGLAAHADGSLHVVFGNHCHRLSAGLDVLASTRLPAQRPYNSFVVLPDGTLVTKDFDRAGRERSTLLALDPETLEVRAQAALPEAAIARLSADGDDVYIVGASALHRAHWDGERLELDRGWGPTYLQEAASHGWDPVVAGGHVWFMDNGDHDFVTTMRGAGVAPGPVHLIRVSLADARDWEVVEVCGLPHGAITNPPAVDAGRRIAVAYDSANGVVQAFRLGERLTPLWRRELAHAAHLILHPDTGELVVGDFHGPAVLRTRAARAVGRRSSAVLRNGALRRAATALSHEDVVVLDLESGAEKARAAVPSLLQSVVFPAPGFGRDLYWCSMSTIARLEVVS